MKVGIYEQLIRAGASRRDVLKGAASIAAIAAASSAGLGAFTRPASAASELRTKILQIPGVGKGQPTDADFQKVGELCLEATKANVKEGEFAGVELTFMGLNNQNLHNVLFRGFRKGFARGCQACEDTINANMRRFFDRHRFVRKTDVKSVDEACIWPCGARSNCLKVRASGRLAQLVERFVYTEDVGGSSPSSPTMISNTYIAFAHGRPAATAAKSGLGEQGLHLQQRRHGWRGAGPRDGNAGDRASEADSL